MKEEMKCELTKRDPFALLLEHFGHNVDELVDELGALFGRERLPVVFDGDDHLTDGLWQPFAHVLDEIGPDELDRVQVVASWRRLYPVDACRLEELLG